MAQFLISKNSCKLQLSSIYLNSLIKINKNYIPFILAQTILFYLKREKGKRERE